MASEQFPARVPLLLDQPLFQRLENFRAAQRPIPTRNTAARMLLEKALSCWDDKPSPEPAAQF